MLRKQAVVRRNKELSQRALQGTVVEDRRHLFAFLEWSIFTTYCRPSDKDNMTDVIISSGLFDRAYTLMPIVEWDHWFLILWCDMVCSEYARAYVLSSLHKFKAGELEKILRELVMNVHILGLKTKYTTEEEVDSFPIEHPKLYKQHGGSEYGYYVLSYVKRLIEDLPMSPPVPAACAFLTEEWITHDDVADYAFSLPKCPPEDW